MKEIGSVERQLAYYSKGHGGGGCCDKVNRRLKVLNIVMVVVMEVVERLVVTEGLPTLMAVVAEVVIVMIVSLEGVCGFVYIVADVSW